MNIKTLGPIAFALLLAACSTHADDAGNATSDIHGAGVCAPLAYPHAVANADYYRQYATDADAEAFLAPIINSGKLAAESGANATFKEITHDTRLVGLVNEIYGAYRQVYPEETSGMPTAPRVAIVNSDIVNAFAMAPGFIADNPAQAPWLFIVHSALMDRHPSDDELRGLFAHELGHLILRNGLPDVRQAIRVTYLVGAGGENGLLGEGQSDSASLGLRVEEMNKLRLRVGVLPALGIPAYAPVYGDPPGPHSPTLGSYSNIVESLLGSAGSSDACTTAKAKLTELKAAQKALVPGFGQQNYAPRSPTATESANLGQLSSATADALKACIEPLGATGSLMQVTAAVNGLSPTSVDPSDPDHGKLLDLMLKTELDLDAANPNGQVIDLLLQAQAPIRTDLLTMENDPSAPVDQIRVYDSEEDADDASVRILTSLGHDPTSIGTFLLNAAMTPEDKAACIADVAAGRPIPFGRFIDMHPATCWRYYHATQFAKGLQQCETAATERTAPKGSGRASVVDKAPKDLMEKGYGKR
jgi:hypothetical protein